jgi:hypothetical protein
MIVFLSFCPLFTIVTTRTVLIIRTGLLSLRTCTITSPFLRNADCPFLRVLFPLKVTWNAPVSPYSVFAGCCHYNASLPNGFKTVPTHSVRKNECENGGVSDPVNRSCLCELLVVVGTSLSLSILSLSL